ncbi:MAG: 2-phospho-L-lactate guanylyltransferase [Nitrosopumilus sp. H13]|nr:MAG: 2-phospho-L-lactate guanylyltransferase [Nitrosopumilus sp. H13]
MKTAAIIPVKTFSHAKTRLDLPASQKEELCKIMLEEILHTVSMSPKISEAVIVTGEKEAARIGKKFGATVLEDQRENGVNGAVAIADRYLLESGFDASMVLPQDIPYIKVQDIDFVMNHMGIPNFAIVVPSRRFDGTNALVRMPVDLMETHYDEGSYKIHLSTAKKYTSNAALVFVRRIMTDVDNIEDLKYLLGQAEKPQLVEKIRAIIE